MSVSRFARFDRQGWLVIQANIDDEDRRDDYVLAYSYYTERESVYVPNAVAAAAPDMLEALRGLMAAEDQLAMPDSSTEAAFDAARAAIAKVEEMRG